MRGRNKYDNGDLEGGAEGRVRYDNGVEFDDKKKGGSAAGRVRLSVVYLCWLCLSVVLVLSTSGGARYGAVVVAVCGGGLLYSHFLWRWLSRLPGGDGAMRAISGPIAKGAAGFLRIQYAAVFRMASVLCVAIGLSALLRPAAAAGASRAAAGAVTSGCFVVGASCSAFSGYCAMRVASFSNVRVADAAKRSGAEALLVCFRGGAFSAVLNCTLCVLGVAVLFGLAWASGVAETVGDVPLLLVGYGFGASFVALFRAGKG